jgi:hypothetical protein
MIPPTPLQIPVRRKVEMNGEMKRMKSQTLCLRRREVVPPIRFLLGQTPMRRKMLEEEKEKMRMSRSRTIRLAEGEVVLP